MTTHVTRVTQTSSTPVHTTQVQEVLPEERALSLWCPPATQRVLHDRRPSLGDRPCESNGGLAGHYCPTVRQRRHQQLRRVFQSSLKVPVPGVRRKRGRLAHRGQRFSVPSHGQVRQQGGVSEQRGTVGVSASAEMEEGSQNLLSLQQILRRTLQSYATRWAMAVQEVMHLLLHTPSVLLDLNSFHQHPANFPGSCRGSRWRYSACARPYPGVCRVDARQHLGVARKNP